MIDPLQPPIDKSWFIRVAFLQFRKDGTILPTPEGANDDIKSFLGALQAWDKDEIPVGESATSYRFLQFLAWEQELTKRFILGPMLAKRKISTDPLLICHSQQTLLTFDGGTSQWASAAALCGDTDRVENPPYKLALTYQALDTVNPNPIRPDKTIEAQMCGFFTTRWLGPTNFTPQHSEDFCFAYAFGKITIPEAKTRWPSLEHHESNRLEEMPKQMMRLYSGEPITSTDHRVIQAVVLKASCLRTKIRVLYPDAVKKSWPHFWEFLRDSNLEGFSQIQLG